MSNILGIPTKCFCLDPDQDQYYGIIWVQTVCEGYQQTKQFAASKEIIVTERLEKDLKNGGNFF